MPGTDVLGTALLEAKAVLAQALRHTGDDDEAEKLWEEIVEARVTLGGPNSHDSIVAKHMYADSLHIRG